MSVYLDNNKRIAKNTIYLCLRMLVVLLIGLYTSRVVLNTLGVSDYGLHNVVGGFVSLFAFLNGLLSQGTSRFLTINLGKDDKSELKKVFSVCLTIHGILALIVFVFGETIGLWFLNSKMNIDPGRLNAANWVYQFSLFNLFFNILQVPYSASVISHERMSVFAYMSFVDVFLKLAIVYLLVIFDFDKLILFSVLMFFANCINILIYRLYCAFHFEECVFRFGYDRQLFKDISSYVGWNVIGAFAFTLNGQGINLLLNIFFGTIVNAARGIAITVCNLVNQFVNNFQSAVSPQVYKYYANGEISHMNQLICNNSKYSAFLVILISLPVLFETNYLIYLWLGQVPDYVVPFIRLTLLQILIQAMDFPIGGGIHAYGKMKLPNITSSIVYLSIFPVGYFFLKLGASPVILYWVIIFFYPIAWGVDLWILNKYSEFPIYRYFLKVVIPVIRVLLLSSLLPFFLYMFMSPGGKRFVVLSLCTIILTCLIIYQLGLGREARKMIKNKILLYANRDK